MSLTDLIISELEKLKVSRNFLQENDEWRYDDPENEDTSTISLWRTDHKLAKCLVEIHNIYLENERELNLSDGLLPEIRQMFLDNGKDYNEQYHYIKISQDIDNVTNKSVTKYEMRSDFWYAIKINFQHNSETSLYEITYCIVSSQTGRGSWDEFNNIHIKNL